MILHPSADTALKSYVLILNPVSGQHDPGSDLLDIESALEKLPHLTVHLTKPDVSSRELAQQAVDEGADVVIAAGGDGTVSGVASVLVDTDVLLGIIPTGTVNAFASALGIPNNIADACDIIQAGCCQTVDTARCDGQLLLLDASIGFEAEVLSKMEREQKDRLGRLAIVTSSLRELREIEQFDAHMETPDQSWHEPATSIMVANAATLSMVLALGPAEITANDGKLSITTVTPEHQWGILSSAAELFLSGLLGRSAQSESVKFCKTTEITINTDPPQEVFVDGDPAGQTPVTITCHPRSLKVLMPNPEK